MVAHGGEKFEGRKRTVSDQDDGSIGEPSADLQDGLVSAPISRFERLTT
jgi:hypothetical protein